MKKIIVRGPALTRSGYGTQTRFALRSLRKHQDEFDIYLTTTNWGQTGWIWEDDEERRWLDSLLAKTIEYMHSGGKFDMSLQVTIPGEFEKMADVNIGYTAGIESTKIAPEWIERCNMMDRVIVVSNHAKYGFDNSSYTAKNNQTGEEITDYRVVKPVIPVNYPVLEFEPAKIDLDLPNDFNFLVVAQWSPRKNIADTIKWWVEEFIDKEVGLVLKLNIRDNSTMDRFLTEKKLKELLDNYPKRKCSIHLLHGDMSDEEMTALYQHPKVKCIVSLAHGEGFGLPLFEAAYNGLPILAPLWSGYCDFCYIPKKEKKSGKIKQRPAISKVEYEIRQIQDEAVWDGVLVKDSMWCYPKQGDYKMKLREMINEYARFESQAKKLQQQVLKQFGGDVQYDAFAEAVFGQPMTKIEVEDLPRVSLITSVFKGKEHLEEFFTDITNQTIWEKCELLMVHPKTSPDYADEKKIIDKYRRKHDNIKYKSIKEDPGVYGCWNIAVKMATGTLMTNCNLDDRRAPDCLEKQAKFLVRDETVDLVYIDSLITEKAHETFANNSSEGRRYNFDKFSIEAMLRGNLPHNNPMWRASLHAEFGEFSEDYFSCSDWDFWLRCCFGGKKFAKLDEVLGLYYMNPVGLSTNKDTERAKVKQEMEVFKKYQRRFMAGDYVRAEV